MKNEIIINGKKYDVTTGALLSAAENHQINIQHDVSKIHDNLQRSSIVKSKICKGSKKGKVSHYIKMK